MWIYKNSEATMNLLLTQLVPEHEKKYDKPVSG